MYGNYKTKYFLFAIIILVVLTPCTVADTNNKFSTEINAQYNVVPDEETVHVIKEIVFWNNDPDTKYWRGFYSNYNYYLPDDAKNIVAYDDEKDIQFKLTEYGYHTFAFNKKVWYKDSYRFYVAYDIEINRNTANFYLSEHGSNTAVTLEVPADFETHLGREDYSLETKKYSNIYTFEKGQEWTGYCVVNSVRPTERLALREIAHLKESDVEVEINYWEGEEEWAEKMLDTAMQSLPVLEDTWNIPFPATYDIVITQASIDETQGYGGFNYGKKGIWLLHSSSEEILVHELAHYWTRACNFDQIWMDEGYADLYTYIVLKETNPDRAATRKERFVHQYEKLSERYDIPLSEWCTPESIDNIPLEEVDFGYKKSFVLTYTIYETIGLEGIKSSNLEFFQSSTSVDNEQFMATIRDSTENNVFFMEDYIY